MSGINDIPDEMGHELVGILYKNTTLNFDMCAMNLVEIFQHLSSSLPQFEGLSTSISNSIKNSLTDSEVNPDLNILESSLKVLSEFSNELQCGELNFYECDKSIEKNTEQCIKLLTNQTKANVFNEVLKRNRDRILSFFEVWQLATSKTIKNNIIKLFNICAQTDPVILRLLFENTNLALELCCSMKQDIELKDFLKQDDFLKILFDTIETELDYLFVDLNEHNDDTNESKKSTIIELFVHLLLAINKKFLMPEENLIVNFINTDQDTIANRKFLSEAVVNLFNFETDPLLNYQVEDELVINCGLENEGNYYINSILKFVSDLFSSPVTKFTTSIFYSNDFNVLIDIILRKLQSLGPDDQIRVDYLSLIQLMIQNSSYTENMYRKTDLMDCFNAILNEKEQATIDQDIIRIILSKNPSLKD